MSSITASKTVEVDRDLVIEACAHLKAADEVFVSLNDAIDSDAGEIFGLASSKLRTKALGFIDDDRWATDPDEVEIQARADEIAADALEKLAARATEKHVEKFFPAFPRIDGYRDLAKKMREQGTVSIHWRDDA